MAADLLPVHGFVLAGGKSSRMGADKALIEVAGRTMIAIAVEKLRSLCAEVSIAGNREDLGRWAPVVHEARVDAGPAAGIEAGLAAAKQPWAVFLPVDVPLVPAKLLGEWAGEVRSRAAAGCRLSYLLVNGERQPAFCMAHKDCSPAITVALDSGKRSIADIFASVDAGGRLWICDAATLPSRRAGPELEAWFCNVNTPEQLAQLERSQHPPRGMK